MISKMYSPAQNPTHLLSGDVGSRQSTLDFRSLIFTISIYIAFFASGASSLIAEVTWNRMLIVVVGNSITAAAMIIAVFMGGLGAGSYVGGKVFGKRHASLVPYILLETTIGIYVLLFLGVLFVLAYALKKEYWKDVH